MEQLLSTFKDHKIRLKASKCEFGVDSLRYLGFIVGRKGVHTSDHILEAVKAFKRPKDQKAIE